MPALVPVAADYRFLGVRIDGDTAIATGVHGFAPHATRLDVFERDPVTGQWGATQSMPLRSQFNTPNAFELEDERLAVRRTTWSGIEITVLEPYAVTGQWRRVIGIVGPYYNTVRMSGDRIAIGAESPDRIEVWARTPAGTYALEDTSCLPAPVLWTSRMRSHSRVIASSPTRTGIWTSTDDRHRECGRWSPRSTHRWACRSPRLARNRAFVGGRIFHDVSLWEAIEEVAASRMVTMDRRARRRDPRMVAPFVGSGNAARRFVGAVRGVATFSTASWGGTTNQADGIAMWRATGGAGATRIVFDGIVENGQIGNGIAGVGRPGFSQGTAIVFLHPEPCGSATVGLRQPGFIAAGHSDRPTVLGRVCQLAGSTTMHLAIGFDYDGRTVAIAVRGEALPIRTSIHFATLMGADLDGDADCTEDALQIAANPALDRNGNGRLDTIEERGEVNCVPPPSSAGTIAELRVIGTEFVPTANLVALATGLPPFTFGVMAVAMSPLPGQPMGPFQLCIGAGATGGFGRYMALQADGLGTALLPLPSTLIPSAGGIVVGLPGDTWGWQLVYRDGPGVGSSSAVRVTLR